MAIEEEGDGEEGDGKKAGEDDEGPTKKTAQVRRQAPARGGKEPGRRRGPALKPPVKRGVPRVREGAGRLAAPLRGGPSGAPPQPDHARPTALAIAQAGLDKKAEEVTVLDVRGLTSYADYFVVDDRRLATGRPAPSPTTSSRDEGRRASPRSASRGTRPGAGSSSTTATWSPTS